MSCMMHDHTTFHPVRCFYCAYLAICPAMWQAVGVVLRSGQWPPLRTLQLPTAEPEPCQDRYTRC